MKYELSYPVEVNGRTISEVELRRPKVRDMMTGKQASDEDKSIRLIANLVEEAPEVIREFDAQDFIAISKQVEGFIEGKH